jgi:hypothetical protein
VAGLGRATDGDCIYGGGIAVTIAVILVPSSVSGCPYENRAFSVTASGDAVLEGPVGQPPWPVYRLAIVIRSPRA